MARRSAPIWTIQCGYTNHGKSEYLAALLAVLKLLPGRLQGFSVAALDDYSQQQLTRIVDNYNQGTLEPGTNPGLPTPLLLDIQGLPLPNGLVSRRLAVVYDPAGEHFLPGKIAAVNGDDHGAGVTQPLLECRTPILAFNLATPNSSETVDRLFETYLAVMKQNAVPLRNRSVVINYTMSDLIYHEYFSDALKEYFEHDALFGIEALGRPTHERFDFARYMQKAEEVSAELREFTRRYVSGGPNLLSLAENEGVQLRFCATSATGHLPGEKAMSERGVPKRVLDPFFWVLTGDAPDTPSDKKWTFIVDASSNAVQLFEQDWPRRIWAELSRVVRANGYFAGRSRVAALPGQEFPAKPPARKNPPLIGPIIERLPDDEKILLLTSGAVGDLYDYAKNAAFKDRLFVVGVDEEVVDGCRWRNTFELRCPEEIAEVCAQAQQSPAL
ncbi:MAG: hypothetical protein AAGJ46_12755 [Planctomycetota bacterium]